jgi:hypothetical protein
MCATLVQMIAQNTFYPVPEEIFGFSRSVVEELISLAEK